MGKGAGPEVEGVGTALGSDWPVALSIAGEGAEAQGRALRIARSRECGRRRRLGAAFYEVLSPSSRFGHRSTKAAGVADSL